MIDNKISLNKIEESIHLGYANDKQQEVALKAKQEILQSFSGINELLEEFYDRLLRDNQFKEFVEDNFKRAINNPFLNKNRDFMELDENALKLSINLYLSGFYKD